MLDWTWAETDLKFNSKLAELTARKNRPEYTPALSTYFIFRTQNTLPSFFRGYHQPSPIAHIHLTQILQNGRTHFCPKMWYWGFTSKQMALRQYSLYSSHPTQRSNLQCDKFLPQKTNPIDQLNYSRQL